MAAQNDGADIWTYIIVAGAGLVVLLFYCLVVMICKQGQRMSLRGEGQPGGLVLQCVYEQEMTPMGGSEGVTDPVMRTHILQSDDWQMEGLQSQM